MSLISWPLPRPELRHPSNVDLSRSALKWATYFSESVGAADTIVARVSET